MNVMTHAELIERIDAFLSRHAMAETTFGRRATGEPALVSTLRDGRSPSLATLNRLAAFMAERDAELSERPASSSAGEIGELTAGQEQAA